MKFPNKRDYIDDIEGYLDEVITCCLTIHKEHTNDSLMKITGGKITTEQQKQYFIGKQLFSDEPIYKLMRLVPRYRSDKYSEEHEQIMFAIVTYVDEAQKFVKSVSKVNHDKELRNMVSMLLTSGSTVKQIAEELCDTGWYDPIMIDSLERDIHRWIKRYDLK